MTAAADTGGTGIAVEGVTLVMDHMSRKCEIGSDSAAAGVACRSLQPQTPVTPASRLRA